MNRGYISTVPAPTEREDEAYLDFVEGTRSFVMRQINPAMRRRAELAFADFEKHQGRAIGEIEEIRSLIEPLPIVASRNRFMRTTQEMMKDGVAETYQKRSEEFLSELAIADRSGPGSLEYDPNFEYPDYYRTVEFHLQPGGYHANPLAGYIYHYSTKVFFGGDNNEDQMHRRIVDRVPLPSDGRVSRVLDMGASCGQGTTAFKARFPEAEIWGIDIASPMLRYAHKRAVEMRCDVKFAQRLAENTRFPDGHFDIVYAHLLFHEIPTVTIGQVAAEAYRVLRPGGIFAVVDIATRSHGAWGPFIAYVRDFSGRHNNEAYHDA